MGIAVEPKDSKKFEKTLDQVFKENPGEYEYKPPEIPGGRVSSMVLNRKLNPYPFARTLWVTEEAREYWLPKIEAAANAFHRLETLTVFYGVRRVFTTHFRPEDLVSGFDSLAKMGLVFYPLHQVGSYQGFAHYHPPVEPGRPWTYYGVVGKLEDARAFAEATREGDHKTMGELLGYPPCCTESFNRVWRAGYIDPIWQAGEASYAESPESFELYDPDSRIMRLKPVPEALAVLRYIGIRMVSHIPHSLTCKASQKVAEFFREVAKEEGLYYGALEYSDEILRWNIEWSVLHGIAEVKTPVFKVSTNSTPTYQKYVVQLVGEIPPEEVRHSVTGLVFPYIPSKVRKLTEHPAFLKFEGVIEGREKDEH